MPDNDTSAGAMPVAGGATPPQSEPAQPAAADPTAAPDPAKGDEDALGEAGKRALADERRKARDATNRANALERELSDLKARTQSAEDKALADAKKAGRDEVLEQANARIRRSEVRAALASAGINASFLSLATKADEFADLKVNDEGEVEGLAKAIEDFKTAQSDLFRPPATTGSAGGGVRSTTPTRDVEPGLPRLRQAYESTRT